MMTIHTHEVRGMNKQVENSKVLKQTVKRLQNCHTLSYCFSLKLLTTRAINCHNVAFIGKWGITRGEELRDILQAKNDCTIVYLQIGRMHVPVTEWKEKLSDVVSGTCRA